MPILEEGLDRLVVEGQAVGKLSFTTDAEKAVSGRDFVFLCLPTPQADDGSADLGYVRTACGDIAPVPLGWCDRDQQVDGTRGHDGDGCRGAGPR